jgi:hypothetical protein
LILCFWGVTPSIGLEGQPGAQEGLESSKVGESRSLVRGVVIPTGFREGKYAALVQIAVDGSPLSGATWDLKASLSSPGGARKAVSGRIVAGEPGTPAVLETQMAFEPGPFELELEAREMTAGQSGTGQLEGSWPDPDERPATVSPVAIVQPVQAAFLRDGNPRGQGALGRAAGEPVRTDLPTALVSVVCRDREGEGTLRVERRLKGAAPVEFDPVQLGAGEDRCVQIRDLIRASTMSEGFFQYEVRVLLGSTVLASTARDFSANGPSLLRGNGPAP